MNWYELENGPLRALKILLDSPLDFDPKEYLDRTFRDRGQSVDENIEGLASLYNEVRISLFPKISSVHFLLANSEKLSPANYNNSPLKYGLVNNSLHIDAITSTLITKTCDSVNLQIDRLLESFKVACCSGVKFDSDLSDFISFYLMSEILFFVLVGMATVEVSGNVIKVNPANKDAVNQLHRKWFANYWEQCSSVASIACFDALPKGADKDVGFKDRIKLFGQNLRDKIFSIPASDLPNKLERLESIRWISKVCNLTALCMWCQLKNDMTHAPYAFLDKIDIKRDDIDLLVRLLENYPQPDRIFSFNSQGVRLDNPSITNQLRIIINDIANDISEKTLNKLIGDFFEKEYIR